MLDAKTATATVPEPLSPAEHERAMAELDQRLQRFRPTSDPSWDATKADVLPEVHSAFND